MATKITIDEKAKTVTCVFPLDTSGKESKSGKSILLATTNGIEKTDVTYKGKTVVVGANIFIDKR